MWGWLYLALLAFGAAMTYFGVVVHSTPGADSRMIVFPSALALICWIWLALTPELVLVDQGAHAIQLGPERWLFGALALLTGVWTAGVVVGIFPEGDAEDSVADTNLHNHP